MHQAVCMLLQGDGGKGGKAGKVDKKAERVGIACDHGNHIMVAES